MRQIMTTLIALIALVLSAGFAMFASAQPAAAPARGFPPHPSNIVSICGSSSGIGPMSTKLLYTVPADRWLVLTDTRAITQNGGNERNLELVEDAQGTLTVKRAFCDAAITIPSVTGTWNAPTSAAAGIGPSFAPGSQVVARNYSTTFFEFRYELIGYLVQP